jgi:DNA polymerase-3 subunit gamma/tau
MGQYTSHSLSFFKAYQAAASGILRDMKVAHETVLYRKYRPSDFSDVLGQDHVVSVLKSAIDEGRIAHAYLFAGSRGTGKTSVARIFAREVGTRDRDLYEIDAASNRGIDDIRELRESVNTRPFESKYKVYIIDEVHMLTKEAWNALLKTLEEPPAHAIFVLATTEVDKIPETILSRCQTFSFKKPSSPVLRDMLVRVAKAEKVTLEEPAAELIALLADGSFRDAHGVLQKVLAAGDKKISLEDVERVSGAPSGVLVNEVLTAVDAKDVNRALGAIARGVEQNIDFKVFTKLLLQKLRLVLLLRVAPSFAAQQIEDSSEHDRTLIQALAKNSAVLNSNALLIFLEAYEKISRSYLPHLPLELAIIRLCDAEKNNG